VKARERALGLLLSSPIVLVLGTLGVMFGAISGMALSWDGSYHLFNTLESQHSFEPHGRFVNAFAQAPTLVAQGLTNQLPDHRLGSDAHLEPSRLRFRMRVEWLD